ncbi:MAG TPA: hypothetical protein VF989_11385 [Polyangiaceae bacterium]
MQSIPGGTQMPWSGLQHSRLGGQVTGPHSSPGALPPAPAKPPSEAPPELAAPAPIEPDVATPGMPPAPVALDEALAAAALVAAVLALEPVPVALAPPEPVPPAPPALTPVVLAVELEPAAPSGCSASPHAVTNEDDVSPNSKQRMMKARGTK